MMKIIKSLKKLLDDAKRSDAYWVEKAKLDFSVLLERQRIKSEMTYTDMAEKLETSRPYVSKVFRGDANLTIETMVKLARATGGMLKISIEDAEVCAGEPPVDRPKELDPIATTTWATIMTQQSIRRVQAHSTGAVETRISSDLRSANEHQWAMEAVG
jgi:transcriptional regulator with XRE-family HTH domain